MGVEQSMARPVQSCRPDDTLAHAARLMWNGDCGSLLVVEGDGAERVVGMITDRDICMCALVEGSPLGALKVRQAMAKQVQGRSPDDSLDRGAERADASQRREPLPLQVGTAFAEISCPLHRQPTTSSRGGPARE